MVCVEYIYNRNHGALLERERFLLSNFDFIIIIRLRWHKSFLSRLTFSICGTLLVIFIDGLEKWRGKKLIPIRPKTFYQNVICTYSEQRKWWCHSIKRLVIFGHVYTDDLRASWRVLSCCHCYRWWFLIGWCSSSTVREQRTSNRCTFSLTQHGFLI